MEQVARQQEHGMVKSGGSMIGPGLFSGIVASSTTAASSMTNEHSSSGISTASDSDGTVRPIDDTSSAACASLHDALVIGAYPCVGAKKQAVLFLRKGAWWRPTVTPRWQLQERQYR
ncbi:hypothetical protein ZWY2020_024641 [Hordeum vulgare]|nr:hypothetical protein ZWY2020_024641 [Hordeum vulgare]